MIKSRVKCDKCGDGSQMYPYCFMADCIHECHLEKSKFTGTETETLSNGAKQSKALGRFDLFPAFALAKGAEILNIGAIKYGEENWRGIPIRDNVNHALAHLYAYLVGDTSEDHLGNAFCRTAFALELFLNPIREKKKEEQILDRFCNECGAFQSFHNRLTNKFGTLHPICGHCGEWARHHNHSEEGSHSFRLTK